MSPDLQPNTLSNLARVMEFGLVEDPADRSHCVMCAHFARVCDHERDCPGVVFAADARRNVLQSLQEFGCSVCGRSQQHAVDQFTFP